jgi:antitoxin (DNA-binding transcriptional repressor) of toxin-antitoxin stability system
MPASRAANTQIPEATAGIVDMIINMKIMLMMRTISMVELRTQSERVVRDLKRGERLMLSYRGKPLAELVPSTPAANQLSPIEALKRAHTLSGTAPGAATRAARYLKALRVEQRGWSERASS